MQQCGTWHPCTRAPVRRNFRYTPLKRNRSNYDLDEVELYAVLFDKDSNVIGVGKTKVESVLSKENRYFEIIWLGQNNVLVEKSNIVAKTNVFLDANFMKRYGGEKKDFQNY